MSKLIDPSKFKLLWMDVDRKPYWTLCDGKLISSSIFANINPAKALNEYSLYTPTIRRGLSSVVFRTTTGSIASMFFASLEDAALFSGAMLNDSYGSWMFNPVGNERIIRRLQIWYRRKAYEPRTNKADADREHLRERCEGQHEEAGHPGPGDASGTGGGETQGECR